MWHIVFAHKRHTPDFEVIFRVKEQCFGEFRYVVPVVCTYFITTVTCLYGVRSVSSAFSEVNWIIWTLCAIIWSWAIFYFFGGFGAKNGQKYLFLPIFGQNWPIFGGKIPDLTNRGIDYTASQTHQIDFGPKTKLFLWTWATIIRVLEVWVCAHNRHKWWQKSKIRVFLCFFWHMKISVGASVPAVCTYFNIHTRR